MPDPLHENILRGTDGTDKVSQLPKAKFISTAKIAAEDAFREGSGKVLLGLVGAETKALPNAATGEYYAEGGKTVNVHDNAHLLTIASSRSGKGTGSIIPNLLSYKGSILAIDVKAELATITSRCRKDKLGQNVYVLDPFKKSKGAAAKKDFQAAYNPMDIIKPHGKTRVEDAYLIADAIIQIDANNRDPHWDESAKQFLASVILHVATYSQFKDEDRHLVTVYKLIMELEKNGLQNEMERNAREEAVIYGAIDLFGKSDRERASVISSLRRHIRFLGFKSIQSVLMRSDFSISDLKMKKTTVFLCLPAGRMESCSRWLRLMIQISMNQMEEIKVDLDVPIIFLMDEFNVLGHMKSIEVAAGQIAGFGVKLWPILQNLSQLRANYPEQWETFIANAAYVEAFGVNDTVSLEYLSKKLGDTTVREMSVAELGAAELRQDAKSGESFSFRSHPLMTPEEIGRIFSRYDTMQRKLIIRAGKSPLILQKPCYFLDARYKDLADLPPDLWPDED